MSREIARSVSYDFFLLEYSKSKMFTDPDSPSKHSMKSFVKKLLHILPHVWKAQKSRLEECVIEEVVTEHSVQNLVVFESQLVAYSRMNIVDKNQS